MPKGIYPRKPLSEEHKKTISETKKRNGSKSWNWKGDKVKRNALHAWVKIRLPKPELCINCKQRPPKDLANISQKYKRDVKDFEWLCRKCHIKKENRFANNGGWFYIRTDKHRRLLSERATGNKPTNETRKKMSLAAKKRSLTSKRNEKGQFV